MVVAVLQREQYCIERFVDGDDEDEDEEDPVIVGNTKHGHER